MAANDNPSDCARAVNLTNDLLDKFEDKELAPADSVFAAMIVLINVCFQSAPSTQIALATLGAAIHKAAEQLPEDNT